MRTNVREQTQHQMYIWGNSSYSWSTRPEGWTTLVWVLELSSAFNGLGWGESLKICPSDIPDSILYRNIQSAKPVNSSWKKEEVPLSCLPEVLDDQATDNVLFGKTCYWQSWSWWWRKGEESDHNDDNLVEHDLPPRRMEVDCKNNPSQLPIKWHNFPATEDKSVMMVSNVL